MASPPPRTPTSPSRLRHLASPLIDYITLLSITAIGAAFWKTPPNRRPFSPFDPSISFPYVEREKVSSGVLVAVAVGVPLLITGLVAVGGTPSGRKTWNWRRKCWEWHAAWLGLGLALAVTFLFTEGLKDVVGKGRPDLLARCGLDPTVLESGVGGVVGGGIAQGVLVSWTACTQADQSVLADGFQSFPSGHSSFSWCGMFYLTLYLCAKFSITIPYLLPYTYASEHSNEHLTTRRRNQAAAPPAYLFILALVPVGVATYIASSRYSDFRHHGFDIIFGSLMGAGIAWGSFRMYHLPIRRGAGWAWGPRSAGRAWGIGVGTGSYVDGLANGNTNDDVSGGERDVEMGVFRENGHAHAMANGKPLEDGDGRMTPEEGFKGQQSSILPQSGGSMRESRLQ